jgi:transcriptional regulator with XRE-family HTH domain
VVRTRPRPFEEWKALAAWGQLPDSEPRPPGYLLRLARERAGLTQAELARRLGMSQQAVARAERWESNPTVRLLEAWTQALGARLILELRFSDAERD